MYVYPGPQDVWEQRKRLLDSYINIDIFISTLLGLAHRLVKNTNTDFKCKGHDLNQIHVISTIHLDITYIPFKNHNIHKLHAMLILRHCCSFLLLFKLDI